MNGAEALPDAGQRSLRPEGDNDLPMEEPPCSLLQLASDPDAVGGEVGDEGGVGYGKEPVDALPSYDHSIVHELCTDLQSYLTLYTRVA